MQQKSEEFLAPNAENRPARAWQRMLSGRRLDLLDPSPLDIEIEDIAHGLARVARWNGQTSGPHAFSVAQHSILVEAIAAALRPDIGSRFRLAALLHDGPEYVIGDLISPFKAAVGLNYTSFEVLLQRAIHIRFGLPAELPAAIAQLIKRADKIAAYYEATMLAGFAEEEARRYFGEPSISSSTLCSSCGWAPLDTASAQRAYLERFEALNGAVGTGNALQIA